MNYTGSGHCSRIAFDLEIEAPIAEVYDCNGSLCRRRGGLLWFGARAALSLRSYRFNRHHIEHRHCPECGIAPFSEGTHPTTGAATVTVNLRCLPELDLRALRVHAVDGARL